MAGIDTSIYSLIKPVEMPSIADAAQKGLSLRQLAMQNSAMERQAAQSQRDQGVKDMQQRKALIGGVVEDLAGMSPAERESAYPRMRQELVSSGAIRPEDAPEVFDQGWFGQVFAGVRGSKDYLDKQRTRAEIDRIKSDAYKSRAYANAYGKNGGTSLATGGLTPGEKSVDVSFGKDAADYSFGGGGRAVETNLGKLEDAIVRLTDNPDLTGSWTTILPYIGDDKVQDKLNPEMAVVRDQIRGAVQGTLKQVLGGQFTEREAEAMFARAFNPRLSAAENARRAQVELDGLRAMARDKEAATTYFAANGTLKGFKPSGFAYTTRQQTAPTGEADAGVGLKNAQAASDVPAIKIGEVRKGYVYNGGDPSDKSSWKKAN